MGFTIPNPLQTHITHYCFLDQSAMVKEDRLLLSRSLRLMIFRLHIFFLLMLKERLGITVLYFNYEVQNVRCGTHYYNREIKTVRLKVLTQNK